MRRRVARLCAAVMVGAVVAAWLAPRPDLTREDARRFTREVLEAAGFDDVEVTPLVTAAKDPPPSDQPDAVTLDVWITAATVEEGLVSLSVDRNAAQAVRFLDQGTGGEGFLTARQQERIDDYDTDPALQRRLRRNVAVTGAGALGAAAALALARRLRPPASTDKAEPASTPAPDPDPGRATARASEGR